MSKADNWTPITCVPVDLPTEALFEPAQLEKAVDIMGADRPVVDSLKLTEDPVYLIGRKLTIAATK